MVEFAKDEDMDIILINNEKDYIIKKLNEIIPGAFTKF
jgi:cytidine deaminase